MVFKPTLVDNAQETAAAVRGTFVYQRKRRGDDWEDIEAVNLSSLKAGEGVRLSLVSSEVLALHKHLQELYQLAAAKGVPQGVRDWVALPRNDITASLQSLLCDSEGGEERKRVLGVFVDWLGGQDVIALREQLASPSLDSLLNFDAAIGAARLHQFIDQARANLHNADESFWQGLLEHHSWALSEIYAYPLVIIRGRAYVGGKTVANQRGSVADFLYRNHLTKNTLVVEIKAPTTDLLEAKEYRNGVYAPSRELAGAAQQLTQNRATFLDEYRSLAAADFTTEFSVYAPSALLVCGRLPSASDPVRMRNLERFRRGLRDVDVVTFDELIDKADLLVRLLEAPA
jgi:hypothetical protein